MSISKIDKIENVAREVAGYIGLIRIGKEIGADTSLMREIAIYKLQTVLSDDYVDELYDEDMINEFKDRLSTLYMAVIKESQQ